MQCCEGQGQWAEGCEVKGCPPQTGEATGKIAPYYWHGQSPWIPPGLDLPKKRACSSSWFKNLLANPSHAQCFYSVCQEGYTKWFLFRRSGKLAKECEDYHCREKRFSEKLAKRAMGKQWSIRISQIMKYRVWFCQNQINATKRECGPISAQEDQKLLRKLWEINT